MPYPNEHSARLQEPSKFNRETFRRVNDGIIYGKIKVPKTIAVIWGKLKGKDKPSDNPIPQALRFPTKYWTVEKAKKWLKDNNIKYIKFEPAKKEKSESSDEDILISSTANIYATIAQLETQIWVMEANALRSMFLAINQQENYLPDEIQISSKPDSLQVIDRTAIIPIKGVLMKELPRAFAFWGIEGTSYLTIQRQVKEALGNEQVKNIRLVVNSPGGTVPEVLETADLIRFARGQKPVTAIVEDLCASGAYWLTSQSQTIEASKNCMVGSIGVFSVYVDSSEAANKMGLKVHIIRSGEHKGMGVAGVEITDTQISAIQEIIDSIAENFVSSVADGRQLKKEQVREWATGQLWIADTAAQMGVIDKVTKSKNVPVKEKTMSQEEKNEVHIDEFDENGELVENTQNAERKRLADLREAFADDLEFAMKSFEDGLTIEQAKAKYCDILQEQKKKESQKIGASAISSDDTDGDVSVDFMTEVCKLAEEKNISKTEAMRRVRRLNPKLHEAFKARCKNEGELMYQQGIV